MPVLLSAGSLPCVKHSPPVIQPPCEDVAPYGCCEHLTHNVRPGDNFMDRGYSRHAGTRAVLEGEPPECTGIIYSHILKV